MSFQFGSQKSKSSTNSSQQGQFDRSDMPVAPDWLTGGIENLYNRIAGMGNVDPASTVAGADPLQTRAGAGAENLTARPWAYDGAADVTRGLAQAGAPQVQAASVLENLSSYISPYIGDVVDTARADFDYGAGQTQAQQMLDLAGEGAAQRHPLDRDAVAVVAVGHMVLAFFIL